MEIDDLLSTSDLTAYDTAEVSAVSSSSRLNRKRQIYQVDQNNKILIALITTEDCEEGSREIIYCIFFFLVFSSFLYFLLLPSIYTG